MIQAELKGKLPELANIEDALTSDVFGLLDYLRFEEGLLPIMSIAKNLKGLSFKEVLSNNGIDLEEYDRLELFFWESSKFGEPDLKYRRKSPDVSPWMEWVPTESDMRSMRGRIPRT